MTRFFMRYLFLLVILMTSNFADDNTQNILNSGSWCPFNGGLGYYIEFKPDGKFNSDFRGEGSGDTISGTYTIDGASINLNPITYEPDFNQHKMADWKNLKCKITQLRDNVSFQYRLSCDKGKFDWGSEKLRPAPGTIVSVGDLKVSALYELSEATENAKFRSCPETKCKAFSIDDQNTGSKRSHINKGEKLIIYAHTIEKKNVNNWSNYWYYVRYIGGQRAEKEFGWVYGEFIKVTRAK